MVWLIRMTLVVAKQEPGLLSQEIGPTRRKLPELRHGTRATVGLVEGHPSGGPVSAAVEHGRRFMPLPVGVPQLPGELPPGRLVAGDRAGLDAPEAPAALSISRFWANRCLAQIRDSRRRGKPCQVSSPRLGFRLP